MVCPGWARSAGGRSISTLRAGVKPAGIQRLLQEALSSQLEADVELEEAAHHRFDAAHVTRVEPERAALAQRRADAGLERSQEARGHLSQLREVNPSHPWVTGTE